MKKPFIILALMLPMSVLAEEKSQSIMFETQADGRNELTSIPKTEGISKGEKCQQMSREIDQLKGKPQRRHVLMEQYKAECELH